MLVTVVSNHFTSPLDGYFLDSAYCSPAAQFLSNEEWTLEGLHTYIYIYIGLFVPLVMSAPGDSEGMEFYVIVMYLIEEENCCI
jgi:hypothetical protein